MSKVTELKDKTTIPVRTGKPYTITIAPNLLGSPDAFSGVLGTDKSRKIAVLTDENAGKFLAAGINDLLSGLGHTVSTITLPPGEATKSFASYQSVMDQLIAMGISRTDYIVALGGGVIGDLTGFCAATLRRGVPFIQVPTTLLSQVDSSVGGKTAINSPLGKNLIGAFYQPEAVLIDPTTLKTLPERELQAGFAEVIKYGLINDRAFIEELETTAPNLLQRDLAFLGRIIAYSCQAKADVVARDEKETGDRALLNLGHTFGHAIEAVAGYDGRILHGEAVAVGCVIALKASAKMGLADPSEADRLVSLLSSVGMKSDLSSFGITTTADALMTAMAQDKKVLDGQMTFILGPIGAAKIHRQVDLSLIRALMEEMLITDQAA